MHADAAGYDSENFRKYQPTNPLYRKHLALFHESLLDMADRVEPESVLEVGCGEGFLLRILQGLDSRGLSPEITGLDVRPEAVAFADRTLLGRPNLLAGSCYALPFPDDAFDLVVCSQVLEHLSDPERALGELRRVARRAVLVSVPREPVFRTLAALLTMLRIGGTPGHVNFWGRKDFHAMLARQLTAVETATSTVYRLGVGWVREATAREAGATARMDRSAA